MKITFILPAIGKKKGEKYIKTWKMEPLMMAVLKSLTPSDVETEFFDDRIELIDFDTETDLIALTADTYSVKRAYDVAARFRKRGIPVIIGGYHVSLVPDEAARFVDSVFIGNADFLWPEVVEDARRGELKKIYRGSIGYANVMPDRSIFKGKKYLPITLVETGRGCVFNCEFCAVSQYYKGTYTPRPIELVVEEIKATKSGYYMFVDDNIGANPDYTIELCKALEPLNIHWSSQCALTVAKNPELLKWMKRSGCDLFLIGFESMIEENLTQMGKEWSSELGMIDELVENVHRAGIGIYATFVFGFDHDNEEAFQKAVDFSLKHGFYFAAFNHLLPFPGAPLNDRLKREGRLIMDDWWLEPGYLYGTLPFKPSLMDGRELSRRCIEARKDFYTFPSIFKRGFDLLGRSPTLKFFLLYWGINLTMRLEVDGRTDIPVGEGLDELPK